METIVAQVLYVGVHRAATHRLCVEINRGGGHHPRRETEHRDAGGGLGTHSPAQVSCGAHFKSARPSKARSDKEPRGEHGIGHETNGCNFEQQDATMRIGQQGEAVVTVGAYDAGKNNNSNGSRCESAEPAYCLYEVGVTRTNENNSH